MTTQFQVLLNLRFTSYSPNWKWDLKGWARCGNSFGISPFSRAGGCVHLCLLSIPWSAWALRGMVLWHLKYLGRFLLPNRSRWRSLNSDKLHYSREKGTRTSQVLSLCDGTFHAAPSQLLRVALSTDFKFHEDRDYRTLVKNLADIIKLVSCRVRTTDHTACVFIPMLYSIREAGHCVEWRRDPKGPKILSLLLFLFPPLSHRWAHTCAHTNPHTWVDTNRHMCAYTDVHMHEHTHISLLRKWAGLYWFITYSAHLSFTLSPDFQSIKIAHNTWIIQIYIYVQGTLQFIDPFYTQSLIWASKPAFRT